MSDIQCPKCKGAGEYNDLGVCFSCGGEGTIRKSITTAELDQAGEYTHASHRPAAIPRPAERTPADNAAAQKAFDPTDVEPP